MKCEPAKTGLKNGYQDFQEPYRNSSLFVWFFFFISERWLKWKYCMAFSEQVFEPRALSMINIKAFAGLKIHIIGKRNAFQEKEAFQDSQSHNSNGVQSSGCGGTA